MDNICSKCHVEIRRTDYFCYNCGNNLKPVPPSITLTSQLILYIKSIILPPFGIYWAIKYLRHNDRNTRIVGIIAIVLTIASFVLNIIFFMEFVNNLNAQIDQQMNSLYY